MTESRNLQSLWDQLLGEDLSGIVFVRDYLQLQFNPPPQINVYSGQVVVSTDGRSAKFGEEAFANLALDSFCRRVRNSDFFAPRALPRSRSGRLSRPGPPVGCPLSCRWAATGVLHSNFTPSKFFSVRNALTVLGSLHSQRNRLDLLMIYKTRRSCSRRTGTSSQNVSNRSNSAAFYILPHATF